MIEYNPEKIEKKWQKIWQKNKTFQVDLKKAKKPYYNLMMFPYPSAEGLHVGNVYAFTSSDIHGRFQRMQGNDVFEPIGFDAFGIHSENFAIKKGIHPKILIKKNIVHFREQLKNLGCLFDWRHEVDTTDPKYYKWTQWLFLQLFKAGLAYRKKAPVDWCPSCKTVLADEQVINGKCERCSSQVVQKEMEQWFFKITKYAEKLLKNLDWIDWSERTKIAQRNWIGKREGAEINFKIVGSKEIIKVFTTRPDTIFGITYMVLSPEHKLVKEITISDRRREVEEYIKKTDLKTELGRAGDKEKTGVFTGAFAINSANNEKIPIWLADYVLSAYGTGAIMAVPEHDERDREFAQKNGLKIKKAKLATKEEIKKFSKKAINYHLRDWLISRQRYWGPPIPIIYCPKCGIVPVPEKDLPVLLPDVKDFGPKGKGESPLASVEKFVNTKCPKCKGKAKRETDVSDTFLDSAWYFFRYPSVGAKSSVLKIKNSKLEIPWNREITRKWLPVDMYIGGQEHAVLHLMYARFITMVLNKLKFINFEEPFKKFRAHGLITKDGTKMSKSKGNVVNPDDYYQRYGADTLRMYLMFLGPFSQGGDWQDNGILGVDRFLKKVWFLQKKLDKKAKAKATIHKTIKKVTEDLENLRYNTAISALMILVNEMEKEKKIVLKDYQLLIILLAPLAPYISEELWQKTSGKGSVHNQKWPKYDPKLIKEDKIALIIQINGKVRDRVEAEAGVTEAKAKELAISSKRVNNWLSGKKIKNVIFVPDKLINIVT